MLRILQGVHSRSFRPISSLRSCALYHVQMQATPLRLFGTSSQRKFATVISPTKTNPSNARSQTVSATTFSSSMNLHEFEKRLRSILDSSSKELSLCTSDSQRILLRSEIQAQLQFEWIQLRGDQSSQTNSTPLLMWQSLLSVMEAVGNPSPEHFTFILDRHVERATPPYVQHLASQLYRSLLRHAPSVSNLLASVFNSSEMSPEISESLSEPGQHIARLSDQAIAEALCYLAFAHAYLHRWDLVLPLYKAALAADGKSFPRAQRLFRQAAIHHRFEILDALLHAQDAHLVCIKEARQQELLASSPPYAQHVVDSANQLDKKRFEVRRLSLSSIALAMMLNSNIKGFRWLLNTLEHELASTGNSSFEEHTFPLTEFAAGHVLFHFHLRTMPSALPTSVWDHIFKCEQQRREEFVSKCEHSVFKIRKAKSSNSPVMSVLPSDSKLSAAAIPSSTSTSSTAQSNDSNIHSDVLPVDVAEALDLLASMLRLLPELPQGVSMNSSARSPAQLQFAFSYHETRALYATSYQLHFAEVLRVLEDFLRTTREAPVELVRRALFGSMRLYDRVGIEASLALLYHYALPSQLQWSVLNLPSSASTLLRLSKSVESSSDNATNQSFATADQALSRLKGMVRFPIADFRAYVQLAFMQTANQLKSQLQMEEYASLLEFWSKSPEFPPEWRLSSKELSRFSSELGDHESSPKLKLNDDDNNYQLTRLLSECFDFAVDLVKQQSLANPISASKLSSETTALDEISEILEHPYHQARVEVSSSSSFTQTGILHAQYFDRLPSQLCTPTRWIYSSSAGRNLSEMISTLASASLLSQLVIHSTRLSSSSEFASISKSVQTSSSIPAIFVSPAFGLVTASPLQVTLKFFNNFISKFHDSHWNSLSTQHLKDWLFSVFTFLPGSRPHHITSSQFVFPLATLLRLCARTTQPVDGSFVVSLVKCLSPPVSFHTNAVHAPPALDSSSLKESHQLSICHTYLAWCYTNKLPLSDALTHVLLVESRKHADLLELHSSSVASETMLTSLSSIHPRYQQAFSAYSYASTLDQISSSPQSSISTISPDFRYYVDDALFWLKNYREHQFDASSSLLPLPTLRSLLDMLKPHFKFHQRIPYFKLLIQIACQHITAAHGTSSRSFSSAAVSRQACEFILLVLVRFAESLFSRQPLKQLLESRLSSLLPASAKASTTNSVISSPSSSFAASLIEPELANSISELTDMVIMFDLVTQQMSSHHRVHLQSKLALRFLPFAFQLLHPLLGSRILSIISRFQSSEAVQSGFTPLPSTWIADSSIQSNDRLRLQSQNSMVAEYSPMQYFLVIQSILSPMWLLSSASPSTASGANVVQISWKHLNDKLNRRFPDATQRFDDYTHSASQQFGNSLLNDLMKSETSVFSAGFQSGSDTSSAQYLSGILDSRAVAALREELQCFLLSIPVASRPVVFNLLSKAPCAWRLVDANDGSCAVVWVSKPPTSATYSKLWGLRDDFEINSIVEQQSMWDLISQVMASSQVGEYQAVLSAFSSIASSTVHVQSMSPQVNQPLLSNLSSQSASSNSSVKSSSGPAPSMDSFWEKMFQPAS